MHVVRRNGNQETIAESGDFLLSGRSLTISKDLTEEFKNLGELEKKLNQTTDLSEKEAIVTEMVGILEAAIGNDQIPSFKELLSSGNSYLHYDPTRIDYSITEEELNKLSGSGTGIWVTIFFTSVGVFGSTISNAIATLDFTKPISDNWSFFINSLLAMLSVGVSVFSLLLWSKDSKTARRLVDTIKKKPVTVIPKET